MNSRGKKLISNFTISNRFIFLYNGSYYYFDIDAANRDATAAKRFKQNLEDKVYEPSFLFTKMGIEANSTNAIGIRPAYTFKFEILFSGLESLIQNTIIAKKYDQN
mgnify:CR=1 FL=1